MTSSRRGAAAKPGPVGLTILLLALWLAGPTGAAGAMIAGILTSNGQELPRPRADEIEFTVAFDPEFKVTTRAAEAWEPVIYCAWKNITDHPVSLLLKEHDSYHGRLDYVYGTKIRVADSEGRSLTSARGAAEGWWNSRLFCSQLSQLHPEDVLVLRPGETVVRRLSLHAILAEVPFAQGLDQAPKLASGARDMAQWQARDFTLPKGTCTIEVRYWDLRPAPVLTLRVAEARAIARTAASPKAEVERFEPGPWSPPKHRREEPAGNDVVKIRIP